MFANFTEETCTGTGDTLALAGITTGNIPFSESFANGDLVAYVLEDSAGTIKVAGIGTYVSATDDITRNDTWNWNGTVIDENPSTNITLSGGTHTVRCDVGVTALYSLDVSVDKTAPMFNGIVNSSAGGGSRTLTANQQIAMVFDLRAATLVSTLGINVQTADASGLASIGLARMVGGISDSSYIASGTIDITSSGQKTISVDMMLPASYYMCHIVTDSSTAEFTTGSNSFSSTSVTWTPLLKQGYSRRDHPVDFLGLSGVTSGVLVADPSTVLGTIAQSTNERPLLWRMTP